MRHLPETAPLLKACGLGLAGLTALGLTARPASADQTFDLTYSGATLGNSASGQATITLDESKLNNPGRTEYVDSPFVTAFSITISGAAVGDGTFGLGDYTGTYLGHPLNAFSLGTDGGTLDFTRELIGQPTSEYPFGTTNDGHSGTFNIFPNSTGRTAGAPTSISYFEIQTGGNGATGQGQDLLLTSFAPAPAGSPAAVPEPSAALPFALGGLGLLGLTLRARRRGKYA